jgi:hypothetical protein
VAWATGIQSAFTVAEGSEPQVSPLEQALIVLLIEACLIGLIMASVWKW